MHKNPILAQNNFQDKLNKLINTGNFHEAIKKIDSLESRGKLSQTLTEIKGRLYTILGDVDRGCEYFNKLNTTSLHKIIYYNFGCHKDKQYKYFIKKYYPNVKNFRNDFRPVYSAKDTLRGSLNKYRDCYDVTFYNLYVKIFPVKRRILGKNEITFKIVKPTNTIQIDLFEKMQIDSICWNNKRLNYVRKYDAIFIKFPTTLLENEVQKITITYRGKPIRAKNPPWIGGFVWEKDEENKYWVGVACEHLGASSWWPVKDHLSDEPDSMNINIDVPLSYYAISNGTLISINKNKNRLIYSYKIHYPINSYNVTFYMGKYNVTYDTFMTNNNKFLLKFYTLTYNQDKFVNYFKQSKDILNTFIDIFGDYPFPKDGYGLVESPYSGMEHQTVIAFGNKIYENKNSFNINYDQIVIHETAHEWWGNAVSASDMADIWLHEGFATYAELLFHEKKQGQKKYLNELIKNINYIFNLWPVVGNYDVNENTFITNDVYNKGAVILHNIRCILNNDTLFFNMIKDFYKKYIYKTINTDTFINYVNQYTNDNFTSFFKVFLYDIDIPVLKYKFENIKDTLIITYKWDNVDKNFRMPFTIFTDNGHVIRIIGYSFPESIKLPHSNYFYFINQYTISSFLTKDNIDENIFYGFTYYKTLWEK